MFGTRRRIEGLLVAAVLSLTVACHRNVFDEATYQKLVEQAQPVERIDAGHSWNLTRTYYMSASAAGEEDAVELLVLSANPAGGEEATVLARLPMGTATTRYFAFTAPALQQQFYAALHHADGTYTIAPFNPERRTISFSRPEASHAAVSGHLLSRQTFTYCFEDEVPQPGDYDFNDLVLRLSAERTGWNQLTMDITVAAVGSMTQVAAAIHLADLKYDDIESVATDGDATFDRGYRKSALPYIKGTDLLVRGLDDMAVVNLFEDAHWATGATRYTSEGVFQRYKYNVLRATDQTHEEVAPRTLTYIVTFKDGSQLDYFTMAQLDPFIIVEYNGILMEAHADYRYRATPVLHEYTQPEGATILPWALTVPDGAFRYPIDGRNIGFYKDGALFGAYMTAGHAFGEWAWNHTLAHDWYLYPTENMVY